MINRSQIAQSYTDIVFVFSVFPSVVWGLLKYNGDTTVGKYWKGLTRFMDNGYSPPPRGVCLVQQIYPLVAYTHARTEWSHIGASNAKDIKQMFAQFGDWCPPPPARRVGRE